MSDNSWNYLGQFFGVNPQWLAAYNNQWDADLSAPVKEGFDLQVPTAEQLVTFRREKGDLFQERFGVAEAGNAHIMSPGGGSRILYETVESISIVIDGQFATA